MEQHHHHTHTDQPTGGRPCDPIRTQIEDVLDIIKADQERVPNATPQEKARLAAEIREYQGKLPGLRKSLTNCILRSEKKDTGSVMVTAEPLLQRIDELLTPA